MPTTISRTVDVRQLPGPQRHPTIFNTFAGLAPGEAMVLVNDHDPKPLYYQFENEMPGQFEWSYVEKGPKVWQVQILKLQAPAAPVYPEAVTLMRQEQQELEELLAATRVWLPVLQSEGAGIIPKIMGKLTAFGKVVDEELPRYIALEEKALYPVLARYFSEQNGPVPVMLNECRLLESHMSRFRVALASLDPELLVKATAGVISVASAHIGQLENSIFPLALKMLSTADWDEILRLMHEQGA